MDLLLDTHVLIWTIDGNSHLKPPIRDSIAAARRLYVSTAWLWEMTSKVAQRQLSFSGGGIEFVLEFMRVWRIDLLPIRLDHLRALVDLPFHHGDPFDRMLVAQSKVEGLRLVSGDGKIHLYDADILW